MKRTATAVVPLLALLLLASGCTMKYEPKPLEIEPHRIPDMTATQPIALVNAQSEGSEIELTVPAYTVTVDLHKTTDAVIDSMAGELRKKGVSVSDTAEKTVKIAVIDVRIITRAAVFKCDVSYTVEAEKIERFGGEASDESWNFQKAVDLAVTETAIQILNKRQFVDYLQH